MKKHNILVIVFYMYASKTDRSLKDETGSTNAAGVKGDFFNFPNLTP